MLHQLEMKMLIGLARWEQQGSFRVNVVLWELVKAMLSETDHAATEGA